jgi:hypothetical protein
MSELPSAGTSARAVVISLFDPTTLPVLISEVERSIDPTVTVYLGSYGANLGSNLRARPRQTSEPTRRP